MRLIAAGSSVLPNVKPPNTPWQHLKQNQTTVAIMTYHYGDSISKIPVRDVTCKGDPKPDPNYETQTYGLFSGCCRAERKSIVKKRVNLQFFVTTRGGTVRVLTGYYIPAWYCEIAEGDYAIAAKYARFINPGIVLTDLLPSLNGFKIDKFFRDWKYVPEFIANRLKHILDAFPNAISEYIAEVKRLEEYSLQKYKVLYHERQKGFDWTEAAKQFKAQGII